MVEAEVLVFKKLVKCNLIGIDILANCPLTKESVDKLKWTAMS